LDAVARNLLAWYDASARVLPWRSRPGPYRTWLSEVMLQQTQVDTVLPYYDRFLEAYPTIEALAAAPLDEVLSQWSGLGYYSRARNMHKAAKLVAESGEFPLNIKGLRSLPGVGEYMAAAIASIAFGVDVATVDGNIARVMARLHADPGPRRKMWAHAEAHLPQGRAGDYNQALMDLGARICRPKSPACTTCPLAEHCEGLRTDQVGQLPPPRPKRSVPSISMLAQRFQLNGRTLFAKRPAEGLWGGLWELPSVEMKGATLNMEASKVAWSEQYGVISHPGQVLFKRKHVLTHRVFHYRLVEGLGSPPSTPGPYATLAWLDDASLQQVGLSALTTKALASSP
jgi:A/G-specific adenine glycosylase